MAEMLHCMAGSASDLSVLDRQRARLHWQHDEQQQQLKSFNYTTTNPMPNVFANESLQSFPPSHLPTNFHHDPLAGLAVLWPDLSAAAYPTLGFAHPQHAALRVGAAADPSRKQSSSSSSSLKKRKLAEEDCNAEKRFKRDGDAAAAESGSKAEEPTTKKESSGGNAKPNSKASAAAPAPKTDYIHVRARRGQATDSHSLAERVRREKISERMKYLQDLVPGCNKITGKAGMLDEIINYVQSLQRQVEFLSMKLAAVTPPRIDFNMDSFFGKEMNPSCSTSISTVGMSSEMIDPSYLQLNSLQQAAAAACCGIDMTISSPDLGMRRSVSVPVSLPETFLDPCFNVQGSSGAWDSDLQSLYNVEYQQGRGTAFPLQSFHGNALPNNLKTEM